ncbi:MAG TPA: hypothetical protein VF469_08005, partial [Kofleriaceae bacterium]
IRLEQRGTEDVEQEKKRLEAEHTDLRDNSVISRRFDAELEQKDCDDFTAQAEMYLKTAAQQERSAKEQLSLSEYAAQVLSNVVALNAGSEADALKQGADEVLEAVGRLDDLRNADVGRLDPTTAKRFSRQSAQQILVHVHLSGARAKAAQLRKQVLEKEKEEALRKAEELLDQMAILIAPVDTPKKGAENIEVFRSLAQQYIKLVETAGA